MKKTYVRCAALAAGLLAAPVTALAQSSTAITLGVTRLDFTLGDFNALSAELRTQQSLLELSAFAVLPLGSASAIPSCLPGAPCLERTTPSALVGGLASLPLRVGRTGLRASVGLGVVRASGLKGLEHRSSLAGSMALDWKSPRALGLTPTVGVRALGLVDDLSGMRYVVLPSIGIAF